MKTTDVLETVLNASERKALARLTTPATIQSFLDEIPYSTDDDFRCPLRVLRERRAHCFDGGVLGAALLRRIGHAPRIVNLFAHNDDEHLIAIFKRDGRWGAVAKSNFAGLRYREPVYRSLGELVMSYFEGYFNIAGERTLRSYARPFSLASFDEKPWLTSDETLWAIVERVDKLRRIPLMTKRMVAQLTPVDRRSFEAGTVGIDLAGAYKPE